MDEPGSRSRGHGIDSLPPKLVRPQLHHACRRKRLLRRLRETLAHSAVWISAGPGSGKTVLASSYADSGKRPCIWYQIDSRDRDPATLFHYLRRIALAIAPDKAWNLPHLTPEYLAGLDTYARNFFERLFALLHADSVLVFDNLQELGEDSITAALLAAGLEQLPGSLQVILVSRESPGAPFARLLANESLRVIHNAELALDAEEAQLVARLHDKELEPGRVDEIHRQTQGWAVGFTLLIEQIAANKDAPQFVSEQIFDYFSAEVLSGIAPGTLDVLLQSAWLPRMPERLVERLCDDEQASKHIAALCRRNYFTSQSGVSNPVYEYHPLFHDCLLRHARQHWPRDRLDSVRRRAASLLIEDGQTENALELLVELEDWVQLAELLQAHAPAFLAEGRGQGLESVLAMMPEHEIDSRPWLLYWQAACLMPIKLVSAREVLERAAHQFHDLGNSDGELLACAAILDSYFHQRSDFHPLDRWIKTIEDLLATQAQALDNPAVEARVTAAMFSAYMARQPGNPSFQPWIARAERLMMHTHDQLQKLSLATHLVAYYTWWSGDTARAGSIVSAIDPSREDAPSTPLNHIVWCAASAIHRWAFLDFTGCIETAQHGLDLAADSGIRLWDFLLLAQCSWGAIFSNDEVRAEAFLARMAAVLRPGQHLDTSHYHFQYFVLALRHGDVTAMTVHADATWQYANNAGDPWAEGLGLVAQARARAASGDLPAAMALLDQAEIRVKGDAGSIIAYAVLLARAELAFDADHPDAGLPELRKLMRFARRKNIIYSNWERDEVMAELCVRALEHDIETDFVRRLVTLRHLVPREPPLHLDNWPWPLDIDTLGHFEVRVDGTALQFAGKSQKRPLALLKVLIALGGQDVAEARLADALWPDAEGDAAQQALATTLHRLRGLIGADAVQRQDGVLSLDPARCRVDLWTCQRQLDAAERRLPDDAASALHSLHLALAQYRGVFLAGDHESHWALSTRERLRNRVLHGLVSVADALHDSDDNTNAIDCLERCLQIDELAEECYRGLMRCHLQAGHHAEGLAVYRRCAEALQRGLGVKPSADTERLHRALAQH